MPNAKRGSRGRSSCVVLLIAALGCGSSTGTAPPPNEPQTGASSSSTGLADTLVAVPQTEVLPAGIYFRGHVYSTCLDCDDPGAAVVLDVYGDPPAAERAVREVPPERLPFGYPLVVHTDELGLEESPRAGIAVVLGLFRKLEQAQDWLSRNPDAFPQAQARALADTDAAFERWLQLPQRRVVQLQAGEPVPALSEDDARVWTDYLECAEHSADLTSCPPLPRPDPQPMCELPAGAISVLREEEIDGFYYHFVPVSCGEQRAYVAWRNTVFGATVIPQQDGTYRIVQTVGAECDAPEYEEWSYDARGRHAPAPGPEVPSIPPDLQIRVAGVPGESDGGGGGCGDS